MLSRNVAYGLLLLVIGGCTREVSTEQANTPSFSVSSFTRYYVSPTGTTNGDGTPSFPWNLDFAFRGANGRLVAGDTVIILEGTYKENAGKYVVPATVNGTDESHRIVFRADAGKRVTLRDSSVYLPDSTTVSSLAVSGSYITLWGLELTNAHPSRTNVDDSHEYRPAGIYNIGSNNRYVNLTIHDVGTAFYTVAQAAGVQIIGCVIYNNGWQGPNRGHGHGLYLKSNTGPLLASGNVILNQFGYGVHVFSNLGAGKLNGINVSNNVVFNNGTLDAVPQSANIIVGGDSSDTGTNDTLIANYTYLSPSISERNVLVGLGTIRRNGSVQILGNYLVGGRIVLNIGLWAPNGVSTEGNTLIPRDTLSADMLLRLEDPVTSAYNWCCTTYWRNPLHTVWWHRDTLRTWSSWKTSTQLGSQDETPISGRPSVTEISGGSVYLNGQSTGRGRIVVYNWSGQASVLVGWVGAVVPIGSTFVIRDAQDFYGTPVVGPQVYTGGNVSITLQGITPVAPTGLSSSNAPLTGTSFKVYVIERL